MSLDGPFGADGAASAKVGPSLDEGAGAGAAVTMSALRHEASADHVPHIPGGPAPSAHAEHIGVRGRRSSADIHALHQSYVLSDADVAESKESASSGSRPLTSPVRQGPGGTLHVSPNRPIKSTLTQSNSTPTMLTTPARTLTGGGDSAREKAGRPVVLNSQPVSYGRDLGKWTLKFPDKALEDEWALHLRASRRKHTLGVCMFGVLVFGLLGTTDARENTEDTADWFEAKFVSRMAFTGVAALMMLLELSFTAMRPYWQNTRMLVVALPTLWSIVFSPQSGLAKQMGVDNAGPWYEVRFHPAVLLIPLAGPVLDTKVVHVFLLGVVAAAVDLGLSIANDMYDVDSQFLVFEHFGIWGLVVAFANMSARGSEKAARVLFIQNRTLTHENRKLAAQLRKQTSTTMRGGVDFTSNAEKLVGMFASVNRALDGGPVNSSDMRLLLKDMMELLHSDSIFKPNVAQTLASNDTVNNDMRAWLLDDMGFSNKPVRRARSAKALQSRGSLLDDDVGDSDAQVATGDEGIALGSSDSTTLSPGATRQPTKSATASGLPPVRAPGSGAAAGSVQSLSYSDTDVAAGASSRGAAESAVPGATKVARLAGDGDDDDGGGGGAGRVHFSGRARADSSGGGAAVAVASPSSLGLADNKGMPAYSHEALKQFCKRVNFEDFAIDIVTLAESTPHLLPFVTEGAMRAHGLSSHLRVPANLLHAFMVRIEEGYVGENPYHNATHAASVVWDVQWYLGYGKLGLYLSPIEFYAALVAAAGHDFRHPGRTNQFLVNRRHSIAITHNDKSVLERFHAAEVFAVGLSSATPLFREMEASDYKQFRATCIAMILSTDVSKHFKHVAKLKTRAAKSMVFSAMDSDDEDAGDDAVAVSIGGSARLALDDKPRDEKEVEDVRIMLNSVIMMADLGHAAKPFELHKEWSDRVTAEFFEQGDEERDLGVPCSPLCDRTTVDVNGSQVGFFDFLVRPLFQAVRNGHPVRGFKRHVLANVESNYKKWKELAAQAKELARMNSEGGPMSSVSNATTIASGTRPAAAPKRTESDNHETLTALAGAGSSHSRGAAGAPRGGGATLSDSDAAEVDVPALSAARSASERVIAGPTDLGADHGPRPLAEPSVLGGSGRGTGSGSASKLPPVASHGRPRLEPLRSPATAEASEGDTARLLQEAAPPGVIGGP